VIGNYLWCNLPVWCSCRTCINYSVRQGCATCGPRAECNTTKWIFMTATSTRQPVWNECAARGLICLTAFGPSVIKVAYPWYTTICETDSLINACDLYRDDHRAPAGRCTAVVLKLFLIAYHLRVPYCHHVPPCSRKSQCAKYHSIKSLENQNRHKSNVNKMAVRNFNGHY